MLDNKNIKEEEMLSTFNCGVGLIIVAAKEESGQIRKQLSGFYDCYEIGRIRNGNKKVMFNNHIEW